VFFNGKPVDQVTEADLYDLITLGVEEGKTYDFKKNGYVPQSQDQDVIEPENDTKSKTGSRKWTWRDELCKDVSAFANTQGGWLVCGMDEAKGYAKELCGLGAIDPDAMINRIEEVIRSGVEPQIPPLVPKVVRLSDSNKGYAILIGVNRSFAGPHRVKANGQFYVRRSRRSDAMDLSELRAAFNLSESYIERIKQFRLQRIEALSGEEMNPDVPISLEEGPLLVQHLVPLASIDANDLIVLTNFEFARKAFDQNYLWSTLNHARHNFEGILIPFSYYDAHVPAKWYFQVFRSGVIEYAESLKDNFNKSVEEVTEVSLGFIESRSLSALNYSTRMLVNLGIQPPFVVLMSLLRVNGYKLLHQRSGFLSSFPYIQAKSVTKSKLIFPGYTLTDPAQDITAVMKPIFDIMWNTSGYHGSQSYNKNGIWNISRDWEVN
jgi:hypothetical protein